MSKHTPTPYHRLDTNWKHEDRGHDWYISGNRHEDEDGPTETAVCIVHGNATSFPVCRDTADFIVRACNAHDELVQALREAIKTCESLSHQQAMPDDSWQTRLEGPRAVLAKAKNAAPLHRGFRHDPRPPTGPRIRAARPAPGMAFLRVGTAGVADGD